MMPISYYYKREGSLIQIMYHMMPAMMISNIIFAQYFLVISVLITLSIIIILFFNREMFWVKGNKYKKIRVKNRFLAKRCIILVFMILVIPGSYVFVKEFSSPKYTGESKYMKDPSLSDPEYQKKQLLKYNEDELMKLGDWSSMTEKERIDLLKSIADIEAEYLGIEQIMTVSTLNLRKIEIGYYSNERNTICINRFYLNDVNDAIDCILHECYHKYQYHIVRLLGQNSYDNTNGIIMYANDPRAWKYDFSCYTTSLDKGYYVQAVEKSACSYATEEIKLYKELFLSE